MYESKEGHVTESLQIPPAGILVQTRCRETRVRHIRTCWKVTSNVIVRLAADRCLVSLIDEVEGTIGVEKVIGSVAHGETGQELGGTSWSIPDGHGACQEGHTKVRQIGDDNGNEGALRNGLLWVLDG